jgi:hypothetical protein
MAETSDESRARAPGGKRRAGGMTREARIASGEMGSAPRPARQESRRTLQLRAALLRHRRRLGR